MRRDVRGLQQPIRARQRFRREEPTRPPSGTVYYFRNALRTEVYDPATRGGVSGILYSEDRVVFGPLELQDGIIGGLLVITETSPVIEGPLDPDYTLFAGSTWTTASARFEPHDLTGLTVPFRVGYFRTSVLTEGTGVVANGIDNARITICR